MLITIMFVLCKQALMTSIKPKPRGFQVEEVPHYVGLKMRQIGYNVHCACIYDASF